MARATPSRSRKRDFVALFGAAALPLPWLMIHHFHGLGLSHEATSALAGLSILGGAFLLSWGAELAERDVPQAFAILMLALVAVLPEYAVDLHFAWQAGKDPSYAPYAVANMTGANRLLIGLGWPVVVFVYCWRTRREDLVVHRRQRLEIRFMMWATVYAFVIPLTGTINLMDGVILLGIFLLYAWSAMGSESERVELVGPCALIDREFGDRGRRLWALSLFVFAGYGIFISAAPFADSLVEIGRGREIDEFLLVQWVAPLASESPEFVIAILFAWRMRGSVGIGALVSSKVNQWTLLVGAIPIAFAVSSGGWRGLPLDARQSEELILTATQSLLAAILIADLRFGRLEALGLMLLFAGQFLFTSTHVRYLFIALYLLISCLLLLSARRRQLFLGILLSFPHSNRARTCDRTPTS